MSRPKITLGVEEEYQLCDPRTGDLKPSVDRLLDSADPALREQLGYELLHTVIEADTPVAGDVEEAIENVRELRCALIELAAVHDVALGIGGAHPFADWRVQDFVDTEGYQWVGHQLAYLARRNLSFGLHVHVGVDDREARVYVANQLRRWCAPLLALSANAPFFEGRDTGFQTIRMHVFGSFPRTGYAPRLRSWQHYADLTEALMRSGGITAPRQIWWNVRPHMTYETVEFRMFDMQIDLNRVRTLTALAQALTMGLVEDFAAGRPQWSLEPAYLADGWFKAQRFTWREPIAHPETGTTVTLSDEIEALVETARPWAAELGTTDAAIGGVERILAEGPESDWQRRFWRNNGEDFGRLQREIIERVRTGARCQEALSRS